MLAARESHPGGETTPTSIESPRPGRAVLDGGGHAN